ncbi:MAG: hypothetical protein Q8S13_11030, partial [Dehalococcoidia bacterium]|nr:hypothetical protein [Dehalococcoidia bacterium]
KAATVVLAQRKHRRGGELERLCDEIAVELLLPYEMFLRALGGEPVSIAGIFGLAKQFDSSIQATALRAGEVSQQPVEVVCWERSGRSGIGVKARRGHEYLTAPGAERRGLEDESPVARAFRSKGTERGSELPAPDAPWNVYDCEARGFLKGSARFVISVARPAGVPAAATAHGV